MAHFFYIDECFEDSEFPEKDWLRMKARLIIQFGEPSPARSNIERWATSLTSYMRGVPAGIYLEYSEDATWFRLTYSKARLREGGSGK